MDREIAPAERRRRIGVRVMVTAVPVVAVALLVAWLPDLLRPGVARARIRTARVTTGPVEAVIMAVGHGRPGDRARALEPGRRPRAAHPQAAGRAASKRGDAVVELDISESVLALDKLQSDLQVKDNEQAQTPPDAREVARRPRRQDRGQDSSSSSRPQARLAGDQQLFKEGLLSRDALPPLRAGAEAGRDRAGAAARASAPTPSASTERRSSTGLALERGSLDKEASAGAAAARAVDHQVGSRRRRDLGAVAGRRRWSARGDVIARIADLSSFRVDATVSDVHAGALHAGMPAVVRVNDAAGRRHGHQTCSRPSRTACIRFTVALAEPSHAGLRPSLRVDVLVVTDRKPRALRVERGPFADDALAPGVRRPRRPRGARAARARPRPASTTSRSCPARSRATR